MELMSLALQGRFLITGPPGKSLPSFIIPCSQLLTTALDRLPTDTCPTLAAHAFLPAVPWVWASLAPGLYQRGPWLWHPDLHLLRARNTLLRQWLPDWFICLMVTHCWDAKFAISPKCFEVFLLTTVLIAVLVKTTKWKGISWATHFYTMRETFGFS